MKNNQKKTFEEDPRYKQCNKEALIGLALGLFNMLWWYFWGYGLGDKPVEEYTYILGLPAWFFMSCVFAVVLMVVLVGIVITKVFTHMSLEALTEEELETYRKEQKNG